MSKEKTAGKTAESVRLDRRNRTVTLTIGGEFYANLEKAAKRLNAVKWGKGNTPSTVFRDFVWELMGESIICYSTLVGTIADFIDTGVRYDRNDLDAMLHLRDNPKDIKRRDQVRAALAD